METILITGGAGFIGSNFVRHIFDKYKEYKIIVVDSLTYAAKPDSIPDEIKNSDRFEFWYGDITNQQLIESLLEKSDAVVHFAAESHIAKSVLENRKFYVTNVLGTFSIANGVFKNRNIERYVHISSAEIYGSAIHVPMTEEHPINPLTPYASSKAGGDRLVYSYVKSYDIPAVILRPFNQYGPCQHLEKVIPRFITSTIMNEPLTVHGGGLVTRDWTYVEDTCDVIDRALHADLNKVKGEIFNIGTGFNPTILEVAKKILQAMGRTEDQITFNYERPGQIEQNRASNKKAEELLGWKPKVTFDEGIMKTIQWYEHNGDWWKRLLWMKRIKV